MKLPPAVIVHGLDMARAALAPGLPVTLLSAPGAGLYAGVGWWQAVMAAAQGDGPLPGAPDVLCCGDAAGVALEALRMRQRLLILRVGSEVSATVWADVAWRATSVGCVLLDQAPAALDLGRPRSERRLLAWLAGDTGGSIG